MNCITVSKLINEYMENRLTGHVRNTISLHIAECQECAIEEKTLKLLFSALHSMPRATVTKEFTEAIMASLPEPDEHLWQKSVSKAIPDNEQGILSVIAYRSGAKPTWEAVRIFTRSMGFVKYIPRPTVKLRMGQKRTRSLTKMPLAFGFRW